MRITCVPSNGARFELEVSPTDTVEIVRLKVVQATHTSPDNPPIQLVFAGTVLRDDKTLQDYNIREAPKIRERTEAEGQMVNEGTSYPVIHIVPAGGGGCCRIA